MHVVPRSSPISTSRSLKMMPINRQFQSSRPCHSPKKIFRLRSLSHACQRSCRHLEHAVHTITSPTRLPIPFTMADLRSVSCPTFLLSTANVHIMGYEHLCLSLLRHHTISEDKQLHAFNCLTLAWATSKAIGCTDIPSRYHFGTLQDRFRNTVTSPVALSLVDDLFAELRQEDHLILE